MTQILRYLVFIVIAVLVVLFIIWYGRSIKNAADEWTDLKHSSGNETNKPTGPEKNPEETK